LTQDDALYRFRLRALALATELGNVRAACRAMGIHPSTFYWWRAQVLRLVRRSSCPGSGGGRRWPTGPPRSSAAGGGLRPRPSRLRTDAGRRGASAPQVGRDRALAQRGAQGAVSPRTEHQGQAPGTGGRLRGAARARAPSRAARAAPAGVPTWGDGPDGLLLHRQTLRCQGGGVAVHGDRRRLGVRLRRVALDATQPLGPVDL